MDLSDPVGLLGFTTGLAGVVIACKANRVAQEANEQAKAANELARQANALSRTSNRIAVDANELSKEANAIARQEVDLVGERNDVAWELQWQDDGQVLVVNIGQDPAHRVRVVAAVGNMEQTADATVVAAGDSLGLDFHRVVDKAGNERARLERQAGVVLPAGLLQGGAWLVARVVWESGLGKHGVAEVKRFVRV